MERKKFITEEIGRFNKFIESVDEKSKDNDQRSYGGQLRAIKGSYLEYLIKRTIENIFVQNNISDQFYEINSKKIPIPIKNDYRKKFNENISDHISKNIEKYVFKLSVDIQVWNKKTEELILAIECKNYSENAMIKRVSWDLDTLKKTRKELKHQILVQLESQLNGEYSSSKTYKNLGSFQTNTILSYFENLNLKIFTLIRGERKIKQPIHKFPKEIDYDSFEELYIYLENKIVKYFK